MKWLCRRVLFLTPLLLAVWLLLTACSGLSNAVLFFSHTSLAQSRYGTLTLAASGMPDGGLTFDPDIIYVAGIDRAERFRHPGQRHRRERDDQHPVATNRE